MVVTTGHRVSGRGRINMTTTALATAVLLALVFNLGLASGFELATGWQRNMLRIASSLAKDFFKHPRTLKKIIDSTKSSDMYGHTFQDVIKSPFPCHSWGNKYGKPRPTSVHKLRPQDISVIGAIGDSFVSGLGLTALSPAYTLEERGYSFTTGGEGEWNNVTTIANILQEFNPQLTGYSVGRGNYKTRRAGLNVAVKGSLDDDMLIQAQYLKEKMMENNLIDYEKDWKLVFIMSGHNDICAYYCEDPTRESATAHKENLKKAIDYLYQEMPRVFVALISVFDISIIGRSPTNEGCLVMRKAYCPCLSKSFDLQTDIMAISDISKAYQEAEKELAKSTDYDGRNDFTLEYMPFTQAFNAQELKGEPENRWVAYLIYGKSIFAPDCFHPNQRGSGLVATLLWNNLMQPVGKKSITVKPKEYNRLLCPTKRNPYLFTKKNSY